MLRRSEVKLLLNDQYLKVRSRPRNKIEIPNNQAGHQRPGTYKLIQLSRIEISVSCGRR